MDSDLRSFDSESNTSERDDNHENHLNKATIVHFRKVMDSDLRSLDLESNNSKRDNNHENHPNKTTNVHIRELIDSAASTYSWRSNISEKDENQEKKIVQCTITALNSKGSLEALPDSQTTCPPSRWQQTACIICGFMASIQTMGVGQAYGMFQLFHQENIGQPSSIIPDKEAQNRAAVALVGSLGGSGIILILGLCVVPFLSSPANALGNVKIRPRAWPWWSNVSLLSGVGSFLIVVGYIVASFSTQLWHLMISQGIIVGAGSALLFNPITLIAPEYFGDTARGKAQGLISAGAGVGGLAYSPIIRILGERYGIRWTLRILGIFTGLTGLLIVAAFAPPPRPSERRTFLPRIVLKDPILYLTIIAGFAFSLTSLIPFGFGPEFSLLLGFNTKSAAIQLAVLNAIGTPARLFWGALRDKIGSQNTLILGSVTLAISNFMWLGAAEHNGKAVWWAFLVIWGFGTSGFGTVIAPYIMDIFDSEVYFGIVAVVNVARGVGSIIGGPLAGVIVGNGSSSTEQSKSFLRLIVFNGALLLLTLVASGVVRVLHARRVRWMWMA